MAANDVRLKVEFIEALLFVHRAKINKIVVDAHNIALSEASAKYSITRAFVITNTIN